MIEENIKKIHKKFDFATKMILQMKSGVSSTMQHIAGSASVHWTITKTALRPGQRLTSEGPLVLQALDLQTAGSASVHWTITKTALRPGQRLTSEGPLPFHGEVSWSSSLQMQEAEVHSCHLSQFGKLRLSSSYG